MDLDEIGQYLLIIGELSGDCNKCRKVGIDYNKTFSCPECKTDFKYVASRRPEGFPFHILKKLLESKPSLVFIDFKDFKLTQDRLKAKQVFKS